MWFGLTVGLAVIFFMAFLRKVFPPRLVDFKLEPGTTLQLLARKYAKWEAAFLVAFLIISCIWTAVAYIVLHFIAEHHAASLDAGEFVLTPFRLVWLCLPCSWVCACRGSV